MDAAAFKKLESDRELSSILTVTAPFDGVVLEQMVTAGKRVEAADPLYRIASLKPLWLEIHVPLEQLGDARPGQTVVVPGPGLTGTIITVGGMVHGADQGVLVRAEIREGAEKLRPGQFVQVQLSVPTGQQSYRVAKSAVVYAQGKSWVFVEQPGGFEALAVEVTGEESEHVVLQTSLPPDARIVTRGSAAIKAAWLGGAE
jgi:multidrug efflux pump subunit AcrA (membrane-fusion protein)